MSQLTSRANQLTGFYIMMTLVFNARQLMDFGSFLFFNYDRLKQLICVVMLHRKYWLLAYKSHVHCRGFTCCDKRLMDWLSCNETLREKHLSENICTQRKDSKLISLRASN